MAARLVVVEGLPGCGKSTFSQTLACAAQQSGAQARWYSELELAHPLGRAFEPQRDHRIADYLQSSRPRWQRFVDEELERGQGLVVMEAWLLQNQVFGMLLANVERDAIVGAVSELLSLLPRRHTTIVCLTARDVTDAVNRLCAGRGPRMGAFYVRRNDESPFAAARGASGVRGLVRFWTEHREICDTILEHSDLSRVVHDVSERNWQRSTRELLGHFGLELPAVGRAGLERFAGTYVLDEATSSTFELVLEGSALVLLGFPFFWRDVPTTLVARTNDRFAVLSWPAEVTFELRGGLAKAMTVRELERFGQPPWPAGTYRKIA